MRNGFPRFGVICHSDTVLDWCSEEKLKENSERNSGDDVVIDDLRNEMWKDHGD